MLAATGKGEHQSTLPNHNSLLSMVCSLSTRQDHKTSGQFSIQMKRRKERHFGAQLMEVTSKQLTDDIHPIILQAT